MLEVDGSTGEGGGQIVRTSLALSLVTRTPFEITNIRANRRNPGLKRQHLTGLSAAETISGASVEGASLGSARFVFEPDTLRAGNYAFEVGTAGSTALVLQTLLVPLATLREQSFVSVEGGTHAIQAPTFEFVRDTYAPQLANLGADIELELPRHGFYPAGGGRVEASIIEPLDRSARLELLDGGDVERVRATSVVGKLPEHIAERELDRLEQRLHELGVRGVDDRCVVTTDDTRSPGNALWVEIEREHITELISFIGQKGIRAEEVGESLADAVADYIESGAPVGHHLADQLLLPMSVCGGGSFRTQMLTRHAKTQIELIPRFLDVDIRCIEEGDTQIIQVDT